MKTFLHTKGDTAQKNQGLYAAHSDFCKIFTEDMSGLHLLALLLTADDTLAEQCFVAGFEDSIHSNRVFQQWAHSWSRRTIIKNAIQMVRPSPLGVKSVVDSVRSHLKPETTVSASLAVILQLRPFERFVLVMSLLEGYTNQDCATLLNCTRQDVISARTQALQQLAQAERAIGASVHRGIGASEEKAQYLDVVNA